MGRRRLECFRGVGEELVAPPVVLRLADLMLGAQLSDRPTLSPSSTIGAFYSGRHLRRFMVVLRSPDSHASLP